MNNVTFCPQPEVNKSRAKKHNLAKESGIKLTNSFDALNEEMGNDSNVIQPVDELDGEDDLLHNYDETSGFWRLLRRFLLILECQALRN